MATDAAYAPDGSSYVIRTYFSATLYEPSGKMIAKVPMPELRQAESIAYTRDGTALLTGSEGVRSPVYRVPLLAAATPTPSPTPSERPRAQGTTAAAEQAGGGLTGLNVLIWLGGRRRWRSAPSRSWRASRAEAPTGRARAAR
ncbi:hypothetical protein ACFSTC_02175 [Nonomuraea ferruginea]